MSDFNFGGASEGDKPVDSTEGTDAWSDWREALEKDPEVEENITLKVKNRKGFEVEYRVNDLDWDKVERFRKAARRGKKKGSDEMDVLVFNQLLLVSQCNRIIYNDKVARNNEGENILFNSSEFMDLMKVNDYFSAVSRFYGSDPEIFAAGIALMNAAGYGENAEEDEEDDPFADSSRD